MSEKRGVLVAVVALMKVQGTDFVEALKAAEEWVAAREKAPDEPVPCPCCTKLVTLCVEHWELREPGKPCVDCRKAEP